MRISRGALAILALGAGAFFLLRSKKSAATVAPPEDVDEGGSIDEDQGVIRLPDVSPGLPPTAGLDDRLAPVPPVPIPVGPPPAEEEEELEPDELEPVAPPFVPPPIDNVARPAPPSIEPRIPDLVTLPPQVPRPIPVPAPPPRAPVLTPSPAPRPAPVPPPVPQDDVPDDTAELVQMMLDDEERTGWKREIPELADWLAARGEARSTKFGPGSAALMAEELGVLPIIRFWPAASGTNPRRALDEYRATLRRIAADKPEPHRTQLLAAAEREKGQSFGPPQGDGGRAPISPTISLEVTA